MSQKHKLYEIPLEASIAQEILAMPLPTASEEVTSITIGSKVAQALEALAEVNRHLAQSKVTTLLANTLMRDLKKRGVASLAVRPTGEIVLRVDYTEIVKPVPTPVKKGKWSSTIPRLADLRTMAAEKGIDISHLGQARKAIHDLVSQDTSGRMADEVRETEENLTALPRGR